MKKWMTVFKIEGLLSLRSLDLIVFGLLMPLGIAALIVMIAGQQPAAQGMTYLQATFGSLITVGICATALMGLPLTVSDYRDKKVLKQLFVTPVHPGFLLVILTLISALCAALSGLLVYLLLHWGWGYVMTGSLPMFLFSYLLLMSAMYGLGMLIASVCPTVKSANLVCTLVYFPMLFLSGATVPFEVFPKWLQSLASVMPLTQGIRLLKGYSVFTHPPGMQFPLILLAVVAVISISLSIRCFRWK